MDLTCLNNQTVTADDLAAIEALVRNALETCGWDNDEATQIMSYLHRHYRRTPLPKQSSPRKSFTTNRKTIGPVVLERMTALWADPVMSLEDIASALSLSVSTTRRLAVDLQLPKRKPGRKIAAVRSE